MALKTLLLHLTQDPLNDVRTETALNLAGRHEAHLVAVYTTMPPQLPAYVMGYAPPDLLQRYADSAREQAKNAREVFEKASRKAGVGAEWREAEGLPHDILAIQAHYADVCIIGQPAPQDERAPGTDQLPDELVLTAGRPIVVIPYAGRHPDPGHNILVAWNGSREAARAVHDALPLLQQADRVTVFGVDMPSKEHMPGADISTHLARHGIRVEAKRTVARDLTIGDALLDAVSDLGCDMIVMGAWGHSRVRELTLGGATRHILRHMTVPVLMSH